MTELEITEKLKEVSNQENIKNISKTISSENKLEKIYDKTSTKIANIAMTKDATLADISNLTGEMVVIKDKLDKVTTDIIQKEIDRNIKAGLESTKAQITVFKDVLPAEIVNAEINATVFNQVYLDAYYAMQTLEDGILLSDRIWDITNISLEEIRVYMMEVMLDENTSMSEVYYQIKSFLKLPNVDMRTKKWRQFFRDHPPGKGVYRSAWKNVLRLLRTETNRAFKLGLVKYAKDRTWIQGIKWELSMAHPEMDICNDIAADDLYGLGAGVYPPENTPIIPHPHCLCYLRLIPNYELLGITL